jgi:hypothetical protein
MSTGRIHELARTSGRAWPKWLTLTVLAMASLPMAAQGDSQPGHEATSVALDRVVAVVNHRPILESDLEDEIQLSVLDPSHTDTADLTPRQALQQLISRSLIQQQIHDEDIEAAVPKPELVAARLNEIRTELPACVRANCKTDAGWNAFLAKHNLTAERVESYLRYRLEILSFIELRFRQGIRVSPEDIQTYYHDKLLPLYPAGDAPPPLEQVSPRIQEILLQQQVNTLFDGWLDNLRKQGEIEVLDPSLETAAAQTPQAAGKK